MLTESEKRVWRGLQNAERHARYYSFKATVCTIVDTAISILVLVASSGAILTLLEQEWKWLSPYLLALISVLTIISIVIGFSKQAAFSLIMKNECREIAIRWERIWIRSDLSGMEEEAEQLEGRLESVTSSDAVVIGKLKDKYNEEASDVLTKRLST